MLGTPLHPYTCSLIGSVPEPVRTGAGRRAEPPALIGDLPSPLDPPGGCRFHPRCPIGPRRPEGREGRERCVDEAPVLREVLPGWAAACHFAEELLAGTGTGGVAEGDAVDGGAAEREGGPGTAGPTADC
ncbi:oligopeptide/dipeptide ABC transporter, ATP-binding protein, C-terminal domain-containing protein [Actinacidiphila yanglinensis]|uniref:Oligopeptide/dipeptide ABC transporter, ATP-binding protein, C-terminal domain-containing protein n=1 Tax=Actinacidiphila yanglinensis TaxID=310779 RepID=A0A1H6D3K6_9ACTN|nr:oligopeptide/dipeptide ABC transporter ATP-binding protein [Actinacidiphila yanglinensis]SEG79907.1 oligopeptide/dipeptide ABC transporter, ATP-binding protein, C-terminal domain-containing protein [Actinacidiphila yanglinensis]